MKEEVLKILDEMRPGLQADGGDIELVDVNENDGIVKVRFQGACSGCGISEITLYEGIGTELKKRVKGFKEIIPVE
ncbi:MAG: hypothetical protein CMI53_03045 [Parcubacteria group bacterium]|nr:hypothetical protein [Parcubacteria group bacterium]|tara:strand:- start:2440 stop:2667 length:228 start_codon:yes stop_codon:yes gene_type:complete